jgi:hypothetical protein
MRPAEHAAQAFRERHTTIKRNPIDLQDISKDNGRFGMTECRASVRRDRSSS